MPPFRWEDIDHSLVSLKRTDLVEELHKRMKKEEAIIRFENRNNLNDCAVPTLILEMQQKYADESARRIYEIYCDVWQTQGYPKSAAFVRAVCFQAVVPTIRARAGAIAGEFAMFAQRTNFSPNIRDAMLKGLDLDMKQLQARWERRLETEAKECEHAEGRRSRLRTKIADSYAANGDPEPSTRSPSPRGQALHYEKQRRVKTKGEKDLTRQSYQQGYVSDPIQTRRGLVFRIRYRLRTADGKWMHKSETLQGLSGFWISGSEILRAALPRRLILPFNRCWTLSGGRTWTESR